VAKILVVDDNATNRSFLVTLLGYRNHELMEAPDARAALAMVGIERPDLVIADVLMPGMDGYEFVRQLRANPEIAHTPVIFCTAHFNEREARDLAEACGVAQVLTKPCEPEAVLRAVDACLGNLAPIPAPALSEVFDHEHLRLLTDKLSTQTDELTAVNQRLQALIAIGLQLTSETQPNRLLEKFCGSARALISSRYTIASVAPLYNPLYNPSEHTFYASGLAEHGGGVLAQHPISSHVLSGLFDNRRPVRIRNAGGNPAALGLPLTWPTFESLLVVPISSITSTFGWVGLFHRVGAPEFSEEDERLAGIMAGLVGRIYENGSMYAAVRRHEEQLELEIVERKRAEEEVRIIAGRYRMLMEQASDGIAICDSCGGILEVNRKFFTMLGYTIAELLGIDGRRLLTETDRIAATLPTDCVFSSQDDSNEVSLLRKDGTQLLVEATESRLDDGRRQVNIRDISRRKSLEAQLAHALKMEAIGRLAGGVAHDFNNLLTVILGYNDLIVAQVAAEPVLLDYTGQVTTAAERAAALTNQLLAFSRRQVMQPRNLNLNQQVHQIEKMLRRIIGEDVVLSTRLEPELWTVKADPGQIDQIIMNLALNSRDAMPKGGKLILETANAVFSKDEESCLGMGPGRHVMLAVSDTGSGIDQVTKSRLFEPFFTTKEQGKGTGLGLSIVYGIVKQSGGAILVYSEPGNGTTFKIYLPALVGICDSVPVPDVVPAAEVSRQIAVGGETILIVEDEDAVRRFVCDVLRKRGYQVFEAATPAEALEIAGQKHEQIDLLLTDVVMPGMGGDELARALTRLYPEVKVLYMSGYTDGALLHRGVLAPGTAFIQKPFTSGMLVERVATIIESKREPTPLAGESDSYRKQ
jgi:two-component system cell cycle sensor histidine kinase/response regulator CckA